jgi:stress-induced morphogen
MLSDNPMIHFRFIGLDSHFNLSVISTAFDGFSETACHVLAHPLRVETKK